MNVIFLDFDGVIDTNYYHSYYHIEKKIKILANICHTYNCKVVIEASAKDSINEETMEIDSPWVQFIFDLFKKYHIKCIGRTPNVIRYTHPNKISYTSIWKEDEIRLYLLHHPEIEHYCIIDDDDLKAMHQKSDLDKVRDHLVTTDYYNKQNPREEGLLYKHQEEIGKILQKENKIRRLVLKRNKLKGIE